MLRRTFVTGALWAPALLARQRIGLDRISILTDESARSPEEAIAFAKQYGLRWVELRAVPGVRGSAYWSMPDEALRAAKRQLDEAGLRVSFLNTSMLKYTLPGTDPVRKPANPEAWAKRLENDTRRFEKRIEELRQSIHAARIMEVAKIRIFAFTRIVDPTSMFPRLAEITEEMARIAKEEGISLLIENEASCNIATTAELAQFCSVQKNETIGINWDPVNAMHGKEENQFPEAFSLMPKKRIGNVQMKAEALVLGATILDWKAILAQLATDGYQGQVGLETHVFDGTLIEKAHLSMKKIQEITAI